MRLSTLSAMLLASLSLTACATTDGTSLPRGDEARMVRLAQDLEARGDTQTAVSLYQRAAKSSKDTVGAHIRLGQALLDSGQPEAAAEAYRTALNTDPDNGAALLGLGTAQLQADQVESAARTLAVAAPKVRSSAGWNRLGTALILTGNAAQAEEAFRSAAKIEPANLDTQSNVALAQAISGQAVQSVATARGITASPRAQTRHFRNLMLVLVISGDMAGAEAVKVPDYAPRDKRAFLSEARKIRDIASPAGKARAIGLLSAG